MATLSTVEAMERLAERVERAKPNILAEIFAEIFPQSPSVRPPSASELARHIRDGLQAEEIVDLWNVVFPSDRNVWYDEETDLLHRDDETADYVEAD